MSTKKLTKESALKVTNQFDQMANLVQGKHESLGIPEKIAKDFAYRCDLLSDLVEKRAGLERTAQLDPTNNFTETTMLSNSFDPAEIGEEQSKPPLRNSDEPYMDTFRQEWFDELRQVQQTGQFSNAKAAAQLIGKMAQVLAAHDIPVPRVTSK
jgi:hypothetical protein